MHVNRNEYKEAEILELFRSSLEKKSKDRPSGIHVSDLVNPLKGYWRKKHPLPVTEDEVGYFVSGVAFEEALAHYGIDLKTKVQSKRGTWEDISYEIDFFDGAPTEFKSSRQRIMYGNKVLGVAAKLIDDMSETEILDNFDLYLQQLRKYMAITNSLEGELFIFFLAVAVEQSNLWKGSAPPRIRCYDYSITTNELEGEHRFMLTQRDLLLKALDTNNPNILPQCPEWQCKMCKWKNNPCTVLMQNPMVF